MIGFLVQAAFTAVGLWLADLILPGVTVTNTTTLIIAALLLGVVNAIVRPILVVLTLPITLITLGLRRGPRCRTPSTSAGRALQGS